MADTSGLSGDNNITGTSGTDKLIGGAGDDTLNGDTGSDFLNAGGGDDTLIYDEDDYKIIGGGGIDTLKFTGSGQTLNLGTHVVGGIEKLWLDGGGGHHVCLTAADIVRVSDIDQMIITGNASNRIHPDAGWSFSGLTADGQSQILINGLAKMIVELPVFVEGFSGNAIFTLAGKDWVTEDASTPLLTEAFSVTVTDPNTGQGMLADRVDAAADNLGTLVKPGTAGYAGTLSGNDWQYQVSNDATQYLGRNDSKTDSFTLWTIDGSHETITFSINGINDAPEIQPGGTTTGDVYELAGHSSGQESKGGGGGNDGGHGGGGPGTQDPDIHIVTGSFVVRDVDLSDILTANISAVSTGTRGQLTTTLSGADSSCNRTVNWTYTCSEAALDSLAGGATESDRFKITISDSAETVEQEVVINLHGAADLNFDTTPTTSAITEIADGSPGEGNFLHEVKGQITASGGTAVSWVADASNAPNLGNFAASLNASGEVEWSYSVNDKYLDYLLAGETVTQKFSVSLTDGSSTLSKDISVDLIGLDDSNETVDPLGHDEGHLVVFISNIIARGLGGDDQIFCTNLLQKIYGDDGNDSFTLEQIQNSLIRGGNGDDTFTFKSDNSNNEIYGDNGNDLFDFWGMGQWQVWGGPGSDTYKALVVTYVDKHLTLNDFDTNAPDDGGDWIDLTQYGNPNNDPNKMNLQLTAVENTSDHFLLTGIFDDIRVPIFTLVGTNLTIADLADNIVGYSG